jgi:hypothetical protein
LRLHSCSSPHATVAGRWSMWPTTVGGSDG